MHVEALRSRHSLQFLPQRRRGPPVLRQELSQHDGRVQVGSRVTVRDEFGEEEYTIVGPAEVDVAKGRISMESPVGKALLGHKVGEEVKVQTPGGTRPVTIVKVS